MDSSPSAIRTDVAGSSTTQTEVIPAEGLAPQAPVLRLQLAKPKNDKKVAWRSGTVDNENMGKKKSKCCCIYKKPLQFGESSSESEDECENCFGHVEKRHKKKGGSSGDDCPDHCDENPDSKSDLPNGSNQN
ncbi:E3 ubiquitin-protein ligase PPP1R11-like [Hermetia illucens]|uniref:E3 ubiquitin-protein ligase PPP1R11-like n=1 Tax=Hermetia illucens TaxID=343691 RepID=UPI0018CC6C6E|nr:E3 ubiquitin-protein ligase PPP1R11-like [Hermetia illucens]